MVAGDDAHWTPAADLDASALCKYTPIIARHGNLLHGLRTVARYPTCGRLLKLVSVPTLPYDSSVHLSLAAPVATGQLQHSLAAFIQIHRGVQQQSRAAVTKKKKLST